jgi:hypothetical protein
MKRERAILFEANPGPQTEFLQCSAREILFGGAAGSGKSLALCMAAAKQAHNPNHRALILRRTVPQLRDLVLETEKYFYSLGATLNRQENVWRFPSGARVEFGFLDSVEDGYRYMGRSFNFIGWDELTSWPGDSHDAQGLPVNASYIYLTSRLRTVKGSGLKLELKSTCTPGFVGHNWVKARWQINDNGDSTELIDPVTGYRRVFIRATIDDNPHQTEGYRRNLLAQPEARKKAQLDGRWDIFEGSVFSEFRRDLHTCEAFEIPYDWEIWRGLDDGYNAQAACCWLAYSEGDDRIYVTSELYQSGLTAEALGQAILEIDKQYSQGVDGGIVDNSAFAEIGMGVGPGLGSRGNILNRMGLRFQASEKGPGSRLQGLSQIHNRLALKQDGLPGLIIFKTCRELIRTLPTLVYDPRHKEDVDTTGEDHLYDCLRYGLTRKKYRAWTGGPREPTHTTYAHEAEPLLAAGCVPSRFSETPTSDGVGPRGEPAPRRCVVKVCGI